MTLKEVMPREFMSGEYDKTPAFKRKDDEVVCKHTDVPWAGPHKNVKFWVMLDSGYAVAFNENPSRGMSFPVIKL